MQFRLKDKMSLGITCLLMAVIYFWVYGSDGFCDTDQGFIQALSWRVYLGEVPYLDFIYVRPPLSIYLHSIFISSSKAVWIERLIFYLMMSLSALFTTLSFQMKNMSLQKIFDFQSIGISPLIFSIMAFVCSVHNYPPMPWHTVDGIFFLTLGIYLLTKTPYGSLYPFLGLLSFLLAALCKQVFYPFLILGPILLHLLYPGKRSNWAISLFISFTGLLLIAFGLFATDFFMAFIQQTTGVTKLGDLWTVGVQRYIKPLFILVVPLIIIWRLQGDSYRGFMRYFPVIIFWLFFFGLLGLHVHKAVTEEVFVAPSFGFSQAMFLLALGVAIRMSWVQPKLSFLLLAMLAGSWCVGISWGYATPMLYFSPILFGFLYGLYKELEFRVARYFYGIICFVLIWIFAILYQYPYREVARTDITYKLGEVFPRLTGIDGGKPIYDKCESLKQFHQEYGEAYSVLPAFPLAHYLTETSPRLPIDWAHNAEMDYEQNKDWILQQLAEKTQFVFLEKDKMAQLYDPTAYGSQLARYVKEHWKKVDEDDYFEVYQRWAEVRGEK